MRRGRVWCAMQTERRFVVGMNLAMVLRVSLLWRDMVGGWSVAGRM